MEKIKACIKHTNVSQPVRKKKDLAIFISLINSAIKCPPITLAINRKFKVIGRRKFLKISIPPTKIVKIINNLDGEKFFIKCSILSSSVCFKETPHPEIPILKIMIGITVKNNQFPNSLATFLIKIVTPTVSIKIFSLEFETSYNFV